MKTLKFATIEDIDYGSVAVAMDKALKSAFCDCQDRPYVKNKRTVTMTIAVLPAVTDGKFVYATVNIDVATATPAKGVSIPMKVTEDGLGFQPDAPDNPDQRTLYEGRDEQ